VSQSHPPSASPSPDPKSELLVLLPKLRAFAISLCRNVVDADDLVQETIVKAWTNMHSFEPGTNMIAWLFTILRNEFYSGLRKRRREVADVDGARAAQLVSLPDQEAHMQFQDVGAAFARLGTDYRRALLLVGASGLSYEEVARFCGCAVGTVKSRVHRARLKLSEDIGAEAQR
jgi:RNA polymerase sigma-70 factor (ECF subfamily)